MSQTGKNDRHGLRIIGYRPPRGWQIQIWVAQPGYLTCPSCGEATSHLLVREGELIGGEQHCDACVPGALEVLDKSNNEKG